MLESERSSGRLRVIPFLQLQMRESSSVPLFHNLSLNLSNLHFSHSINSPNTRVLNLDINDVVAAVASALKEEVEGDDGPPPLISLKDRGLADQLDGRLNDAYTGYYKLSDLPTKSGEVGLA